VEVACLTSVADVFFSVDGIDHGADLPAGPAEYPNEPASKYTGAKVLLPGQAPAANIILAFEYGGGWRDIQVTTATLG
jgi:hypothetical protein